MVSIKVKMVTEKLQQEGPRKPKYYEWLVSPLCLLLCISASQYLTLFLLSLLCTKSLTRADSDVFSPNNLCGTIAIIMVHGSLQVQAYIAVTYKLSVK